MTSNIEMPSDAPPPVDWDLEAQELIRLLVEAVLMLPDNEKRRVIDQAVASFFDALVTLNKVPGVGLIWMSLICSGYRDLATRLCPPRATLSEEPASVASGFSELKEIPNVA
jgi:hypothetical protein